MADPILPRCQGVILAPGTYTNATVTVNADGCISVVASGAPEVYTPDDCCIPAAGAGTPGPRGFTGDPGAAATISVAPVVVGATNAWSVANIGTPQAAILEFTAPVGTGATPVAYATQTFVDGLLQRIIALEAAVAAGGVGGTGAGTVNNGATPINATYTMPSGTVVNITIPPGGSATLPTTDAFMCDTSPPATVYLYNDATGTIITQWTVTGTLACGGE